MREPLDVRRRQRAARGTLQNNGSRERKRGFFDSNKSRRRDDNLYVFFNYLATSRRTRDRAKIDKYTFGRLPFI